MCVHTSEIEVSYFYDFSAILVYFLFQKSVKLKTIIREDMKHKVIYIALVILSISLISCSDGPINTITLRNIAAGDVYLSFRGEQINVPSGQTVELQDIDKGEYEYETIFSIPAGATSFSSEGEMTGTLTLQAGKKILIIYSSVLDQEGGYTIYASVISSDDVSEEGILPDPISP